MSKLAKYSAAILILLLTSIILTIALSPMTAVAQEDTTPDEQAPEGQTPPPTPPQLSTLPENKGGVVVIASLGGTTNPAPGEYTFDNQSRFTIEATPYQGFKFAYWVISGAYLPGHNLPPVIVPLPEGEDQVPPSSAGATQANWDSLVISQNPLDVIHGYGYVYQYQAIFLPTTPTTSPVAGTVIIKSAVGGSTNPKAGSYFYTDVEPFSITATPDEGYAFQYWVISGGPLPGHGTITGSQIADNPLTTHAVIENMYEYQPVFALHPTTSGIPVEYFYAAIVILAIIAVIGIAAALMYRSRGKK